jgi:hypothetical protein
MENETDRSKRVEEYEICKRRGHVEGSLGIGPYSVCEHCGVHYRWVTTLEEVSATLPTKILRPVEGTNMIVYEDAPIV